MISIAIDGPAGAGKSTIAKTLAKKLSYIYVDTGALYRAIALSVIQGRISPDNETEIGEMLQHTEIELKFIDGIQRVLLNGEDVSGNIRTSEVSMMASKTSALPIVRSFLLDLQRDIAKKNNILMDGRDIGTVVLPNAQVKIFLTASPECRAKRRYQDYLNAGNTSECYEEILKDIIQRDYQDSHRTTAPLKQADDAILVDTSEDTLEESVEKIMAIIQARLS